MAEKNSIESSTFYNYVKNQKDKNTFKTIDQSQLDFIEDNKIEFGIVAKGSSISELLKSKVTKEIKDNVTGDTLIMFRSFSK